MAAKSAGSVRTATVVGDSRRRVRRPLLAARRAGRVLCLRCLVCAMTAPPRYGGQLSPTVIAATDSDRTVRSGGAPRGRGRGTFQGVQPVQAAADEGALAAGRGGGAGPEA